MDNGPHRADRCAAKFHPDKRGNTEQEKDEEKNQKSRIDGKDGGRQNAGERQHREKQSVTISDGAIEAHHADENQKVYRPQQQSEKRRLGEFVTANRERNRASTGKNTK